MRWIPTLIAAIIIVALFKFRGGEQKPNAIESMIEQALLLADSDEAELISEEIEEFEKTQNSEKLITLRTKFNDLGRKDIASLFAFKYAEIARTDDAWLEAAVEIDSALNGNYFDSVSSSLKEYFVKLGIKGYEKVLESQPDNLELKTELGALTASHYRPMEGVKIWLEVVRKDSLQIKANLNLGRFALISGQYDKAQRRFKTVLSQDSLNVEALIGLGNTLVQNGENAQAMNLYQKALDNSADNAEKQELEVLLKQLKEL